MTEPALISITLFLLMICVTNWRIGFFITILFGFLQDPIRKLLPGEPVYMVVFISIFIVATLIGAKLNNVPLSFRSILKESPSLKLPMSIFIFFVLIQAFVTIISINSFVLAGIGLMAYLTPWIIIPIAYQYVRKEDNIVIFLKTYLFISIFIASGIYLSFSGIEWRVFEQVGEGLVAFSPLGEKLVLHCGFMRSPEVAAWHASTSACITIILFISQKKRGIYSWLSAFILIYFITAIILTGRRKMLMEIMLFIAFFAGSLFYFRRGASKLAFLLLVCGIAATFIGNYFLTSYEIITNILPYYQRGMSVGEDAPDRMHLMTIAMFKWVILRNGFFGSGAGTGSQGARFFGGGTSLVGGAAEGGLGKILAELGVPGLFLIFWLSLKLFRYFWSLMQKAGTHKQSLLLYGMISFLISNAIVFITAHQIFGDLFVLFILGNILGFIMAISKLIKNTEKSAKLESY